MNSLTQFVSNDEMLMLDVNQGWSFDEAKGYLKILENYNFSWIEEPISALSEREKFTNLIAATECNLAFGENIVSFDDFTFLGQNNRSKYIQPDLTKFGGVSLIKDLSHTIQNKKIWIHFLGGGVGLLTSAHILSAINPDAFLETDINLNPLRTNIFENDLEIIDGKVHLGKDFGIGGPFNFDTIDKYLIASSF